MPYRGGGEQSSGLCNLLQDSSAAVHLGNLRADVVKVAPPLMAIDKSLWNDMRFNGYCDTGTQGLSENDAGRHGDRSETVWGAPALLPWGSRFWYMYRPTDRLGADAIRSNFIDLFLGGVSAEPRRIVSKALREARQRCGSIGSSPRDVSAYVTAMVHACTESTRDTSVTWRLK